MSVISVCCTAVWAGGDGLVCSCTAPVMRFRQQDFLISHKQDRSVYFIIERIFTKCFIVIVFVSRSDYCSIVGLTIWQQIAAWLLGSLTIVSTATPSACLKYLILNLWELSSELNNLLHSAHDLWWVPCCSRAAAPPSLINTWSFAKTRLMYNYTVLMAGEGCCQGTQRTQVDGCSIVYGLSHAASCASHDSIWITASSIHPSIQFWYISDLNLLVCGGGCHPVGPLFITCSDWLRPDHVTPHPAPDWLEGRQVTLPQQIKQSHPRPGLRP